VNRAASKSGRLKKKDEAWGKSDASALARWSASVFLAVLPALSAIQSARAVDLFAFRDSSGHVLTFAVPGTEPIPATIDQAAATQAALH
jgi:hypothetical protein